MRSIDKSRLRAEAVRLLRSEVGNGEEPPKSNSGRHVARYLAVQGAKPPAEWCAALQSYCYSIAAQNLGLELPFKPSLGAGALIRAVGAVGRLFTDPLQAVPGDLIGFYRGSLGRLDWRRHVGMVVLPVRWTGVVHIVCGNESRNGVVRERAVVPAHSENFWTFASMHEADIPG